MQENGGPDPPEEEIDDNDVVVTFEGLPAFGFHISRPHLHRLIRQGRFPKPFKVTANRNGWMASWLLKHRAERIAARNQPKDTRQQSAAAKVSVEARRAKRNRSGSND
jgi:hypothetical protein